MLYNIKNNLHFNTALSFKKVLCFRKVCYFIAGEVLIGKGDFRIHFSDFQ